MAKPAASRSTRRTLSRDELADARREAQRHIAKRDRRARAAKARDALRTAMDALRDFYEPAIEEPPLADDGGSRQRILAMEWDRLRTQLEHEERGLARYVESNLAPDEAEPGETERDVMIRLLADPNPADHRFYPPKHGDTPIASQRQIAAWIAGCDDAPADEMDADPRADAARAKVRRAAARARERHAAEQKQLEEREDMRSLIAQLDAFLDEK